MEAMIRAGAFDTIEPNRASLLASLGAAIDAADHAEQFASQTNLFGEAGGATQSFELTRAPMWAERERLVNEKQSLGFYLSGHPVQRLPRRAAPLRAHAARQPRRRSIEPMMLAGVIYGVQMRNSRRGRMAILTLDDGSARVEVVVFGELFHEKRAVVQEDQVIVVRRQGLPGRVLRRASHHRRRADGPRGGARGPRAAAAPVASTARPIPRKLKSLLAQYAGGQVPRRDPLPQRPGRVRHPPAGELQGQGVGAAARFARRNGSTRRMWKSCTEGAGQTRARGKRRARGRTHGSAAEGQDGAGDGRELRHRSRDREGARARGRARGLQRPAPRGPRDARRARSSPTAGARPCVIVHDAMAEGYVDALATAAAAAGRGADPRQQRGRQPRLRQGRDRGAVGGGASRSTSRATASSPTGCCRE